MSDYFLSIFRNSSIGCAGMLMMCTVPLDPSSIETLVMASLSGASTMFRSEDGQHYVDWHKKLLKEKKL
jgi:hypothetical protein